VHGSINIGADGMRMTSGDTARGHVGPVPGNALSAEEAAELQALRQDTKLEDLQVSSDAVILLMLPASWCIG
jgi:hypothetical protein